MNRLEELQKIFEDCDQSKRSVIFPLLKEMVFVENQLDYLRKLPFIQVHSTKKELQRSTPSYKMYKELLQQYANIVRIVERANGNNDGEEESPLRKWAKSRSVDI